VGENRKTPPEGDPENKNKEMWTEQKPRKRDGKLRAETKASNRKNRKKTKVLRKKEHFFSQLTGY